MEIDGYEMRLLYFTLLLPSVDFWVFSLQSSLMEPLLHLHDCDCCLYDGLAWHLEFCLGRLARGRIRKLKKRNLLLELAEKITKLPAVLL